MGPKRLYRGKSVPSKEKAAIKSRSLPKEPSSSEEGDVVEDSLQPQLREPTPPPPAPPAGPDAEERDATPPGADADPPEKRARTSRKKAEKAASADLSEQQEIDMSQWLQERPYFYHKGHKKFRETHLKSREWEQKAVELKTTSESLHVWHDSVRTKLGKLTKLVSGSEARQHTDRDNFLLQHFSFFKEHIVRKPGRLAVSVSMQCQLMIYTLH